MKKFFAAIALVSLSACAESSSPDYTLSAREQAVIVDVDGREFNVVIDYDPEVVSPDLVAELVYAIEVVGVTPIDPVYGVDSGFELEPENSLWFNPNGPIDVSVTIDADDFTDYEWRWIDDLDTSDLQDGVSDVCPPWH